MKSFIKLCVCKDFKSRPMSPTGDVLYYIVHMRHKHTYTLEKLVMWNVIKVDLKLNQPQRESNKVYEGYKIKQKIDFYVGSHFTDS